MCKTIKLTRGVYLRGASYWLKFQREGKRRYISLETGDPMEALRRASEMRAFQFPDQPTPLLRAIEDYLADKRRLIFFKSNDARD